ncbi:antitoxin [Mycolicibacterium litorale]|uniref:antitoxin n=1 Tax=Mycolicibacterium litorale TaxID=758802 RepID=UPI0039A1111F
MAFLDKVKNWVSKNPDKAGTAIEKAGDLFDRKTRGKYAPHVDKAQNAARDYVNKNTTNRIPPPQPPIDPQPPRKP